MDNRLEKINQNYNNTYHRFIKQTPASIGVKDEVYHWKKVQVGKDQEKAQSEKDSHSKNRGGKQHTSKVN